jgi:raffinose/stachyose/melibiose transport system permease protein
VTAITIERTGRRRTGSRTAWLTVAAFVVPALLLYATFVLVPIVQAAYYSLFKWNGLQPLTDFVGLRNYQVALSNGVFQTSVANNILVVVLSLAIQIPFSLGLAVLLNPRFPGRGVLRLILFLP